jgi:hypothetical protein
VICVHEPCTFLGLDHDAVEDGDLLVDQDGLHGGEVVPVARLHRRAGLECGVGDGVVGRFGHAETLRLRRALWGSTVQASPRRQRALDVYAALFGDDLDPVAVVLDPLVPQTCHDRSSWSLQMVLSEQFNLL